MFSTFLRSRRAYNWMNDDLWGLVVCLMEGIWVIFIFRVVLMREVRIFAIWRLLYIKKLSFSTKTTQQHFFNGRQITLSLCLPSNTFPIIVLKSNIHCWLHKNAQRIFNYMKLKFHQRKVLCNSYKKAQMHIHTNPH